MYAVYLWSYRTDADGLYLFDIRDVHRGTLGLVRATHAADALRRWDAQ